MGGMITVICIFLEPIGVFELLFLEKDVVRPPNLCPSNYNLILVSDVVCGQQCSSITSLHTHDLRHFYDFLSLFLSRYYPHGLRHIHLTKYITSFTSLVVKTISSSTSSEVHTRQIIEKKETSKHTNIITLKNYFAIIAYLSVDIFILSQFFL